MKNEIDGPSSSPRDFCRALNIIYEDVWLKWGMLG